MTPAVLWLIAGVVLVAAEALSGDFVLVMLGVAALAAAGVDVLGAPLWLDAVVFAVVSLGLIAVVRPAIKRRMNNPRELRTNVSALVGKEAFVVSEVDARGGRIRLDGEVWSARAQGDDVFEVGERVTVIEIAGATAVVGAGI